MAMDVQLKRTTLNALLPMRASFLAELNDYVVYEAPLVHQATRHYTVSVHAEPIGYLIYNSDSRTVLEGWIEPPHRETGAAVAMDWLRHFRIECIRAKTNDPFLCRLLLDTCRPVSVESLHFDYCRKMNLQIKGARLRPAEGRDLGAICGILCTPDARELEVDDESIVRQAISAGDTYWVLDINGTIAGVGAIWYNKLQNTFVDVGMAVHPDWRRRGFGSFIVQEMGAVCKSKGVVPGAGCFIDHEASRRTLERAGFQVTSRMLLGVIAENRLRHRRPTLTGRLRVTYT